MAVVVNGDATAVHVHLAWLQGFQGFFLAGQGVVKNKAHGTKTDNGTQRFNTEKGAEAIAIPRQALHTPDPKS